MKMQKTNKWILIYGVIAALLIALHYVLQLSVFEVWNEYVPFLEKLSMSLFLIALIFMVSKIIRKLINTRAHLEGDRYNLLRITRLLAIVSSLIVATSFLFQNLYAAVVSFGLISLIIGFALQAPITSFIAWIYLIFRRPYLVGDRIQINGLRGDVVEINYLDTTMLECSGDYLVNDRRSGRIIRFPNSLILKEEVINYSGPDFPFIWNETPIQVAYTSDLEFVEECLLAATNRDFREHYRHFAAHEWEEWEPAVYFRINTYAWMEAVISYPVEPRDTTGRRNRILRYALALLNEAPDKVQFPEGTLR
ncbi:mechanosensitive ion channel family protein [Membranicola marinus]|uniref:Mechanosensitive ion channel family protein n=1 Tax=Membranihabitans marinus TaxID=1227546 RepID=A0A953HUP0_9BACT|nr:mechanosensitive ion channel domain-containing protein [Membranihabitans marinus]MBY5958630.1 mechanosensitive ion channel family protein [Membranihabitans marinus]